MKTFEEGILKLLYMTAAIDGDLNRIELDSIKAKLVTYPLLKTITSIRRERVLSDLMENNYNSKSESEILKEINDVIHDNLKETAYALALEICAKDLVMHKNEIAFMKKVAKLFGIDDATAEALRKSVDVRYFASPLKD